MRTLHRELVCLALLLGMYACPICAQEIDLENLPEDVDMQFATGPFAQAYSISNRINPFYLRGDFDGDGKPDYAVLVVSKKDKLNGIAIWLSSKAKIFVLGAGHPFKLGAEVTSDFTVLDTWQVYGKKAVEQGVGVGPPPKLIGEAILAGKRESASGLIYWNGSRFVWYQQGD